VMPARGQVRGCPKAPAAAAALWIASVNCGPAVVDCQAAPRGHRQNAVGDYKLKPIGGDAATSRRHITHPMQNAELGHF